MQCCWLARGCRCRHTDCPLWSWLWSSAAAVR